MRGSLAISLASSLPPSPITNPSPGPPTCTGVPGPPGCQSHSFQDTSLPMGSVTIPKHKSKHSLPLPGSRSSPGEGPSSLPSSEVPPPPAGRCYLLAHSLTTPRPPKAYASPSNAKLLAFVEHILLDGVLSIGATRENKTKSLFS